jgi:predicted CoA-binding protein
MISKENVYAVVGVSNNPEKYGHRVYKDLLEGGYHVYAIHPKLTTLFDNPVYPRISDTPENLDVVIFVVPPSVGLEVLEEVKLLGIKNVWFQPGSESPELIEFCVKNKIDYVSDACIMIERKAQ